MNHPIACPHCSAPVGSAAPHPGQRCAACGALLPLSRARRPTLDPRLEARTLLSVLRLLHQGREGEAVTLYSRRFGAELNEASHAVRAFHARAQASAPPRPLVPIAQGELPRLLSRHAALNVALLGIGLVWLALLALWQLLLIP